MNFRELLVRPSLNYHWGTLGQEFLIFKYLLHFMHMFNSDILSGHFRVKLPMCFVFSPIILICDVSRGDQLAEINDHLTRMFWMCFSGQRRANVLINELARVKSMGR